MTDPGAQLAALRALRSTVTDPAQGTALDALIAGLEAGVAARTHTQSIGDSAQVDLAVAGDVHGNVYLDGRRADAAARLLASYLARLRGRCGAIPLEGMRRQQQVGDVLPIRLDQVYTQLAVTGVARREVFTGAARPAQKSGARSSVDSQISVFGAQLMAALRGAVPGQGAGIGVFELFAALAQHIPTDARSIIYRDQPLDQHPLLYAHQVDQDFAVALRPGWRGGTLDTSLAETIRQLAESEVALAAYPSEAEAPTELVRRRDELLAWLGR